MIPPNDYESYETCPNCSGCLCEFSHDGGFLGDDLNCKCGYFEELEEHKEKCKGCMQCWSVPKFTEAFRNSNFEQQQLRFGGNIFGSDFRSLSQDQIG